MDDILLMVSWLFQQLRTIANLYTASFILALSLFNVFLRNYVIPHLKNLRG